MEAAFGSGVNDQGDSAAFAGTAGVLGVTDVLAQPWVRVAQGFYQADPSQATSSAPVWSIDGAGRAYVSTAVAGVRNMAIIDGASRGSVTLTVAVAQTAQGLVFRFKDPYNFWCLEDATTTVNIMKVKNGVATNMGNTGAATWTGTGTMGVTLKRDGSFDVLIGGVVKKTITDDFNAEQFRTGMLQPSAGAGRMDQIDIMQVWSDLTPYIHEKGGTISRGKNRVLDRTEASVADITLRNDKRQFDPLYTAGPFYGLLEGGTPIRISTEHPWLPGLVPNYDFSAGVTPWTATAGALSTAAAAWSVLSTAMVFTSNGGATPAVMLPNFTLPVVAGVTYAATIRMKGSAAQSWRIHIQWFDAGGASLGQTDGAVTAVTTTGNPTKLSVSGTAPVGAITARIFVDCTGTPANGNTWQIWAPVFDRSAGGVMALPRYYGYVERWEEMPFGIQESTTICHIADIFKQWALLDLPASPHEAVVRKGSPLGWWRFNDPDISTISDSSGNNHPLNWSFSSGIGYQKDGPDTHNFDENNKAVLTLNTSAGPKMEWAQIPAGILPTSGVPFGVSVWVNVVMGDPGSGVTIDFFDQGYYGSSYTLLSFQWIPGGTDAVSFKVGSGGGGYVTTISGKPSRFADGTWHHLVGGYDGTYGYLWVDTVRYASGTAATGPFNDVPLNLMTIVGQYGVEIQWSEFIIYPFCPTQGSVNEEYNALVNGWKGDTADTRMHRILDIANVPRSMRNIDPEPDALQGTSLGSSVLEYLGSVGSSVYSFDYVQSDGKFRHRSRGSRQTANSSLATLGPGGVEYRDVHPDNTDERLINWVRLGRKDGSIIEFIDPASRAQYGPRKYERTDLLLDNDEVVVDLGNYLLQTYKDTLYYWDELTLDAVQDDAVWAQILGRALDDRVTVTRRYPVGPNSSVDLIINQIADTFGRNSWQTKYSLSPAEVRNWLILDSAIYGTVDANNALAY